MQICIPDVIYITGASKLDSTVWTVVESWPGLRAGDGSQQAGTLSADFQVKALVSAGGL